VGRIDDALRKTEKRTEAEGQAGPAAAEAPFSRYGFPLADFTHPSPLAESYRTLRTNIQRDRRAPSIKSLLIASASQGEGRTQTAANLAVVASAVEGSRTLLIDGDLRHPQLHEIFEIEQNPGLSNFLQGGVAQEDVVRSTRISNLSVIPSGEVSRNPAELFQSPKLAELIEAMKAKYDTILFDSAPVIPFTDSAILATQADAIILVVRARESRREVVRRMKDLLNKTEDKIVGVVFNRVEYVIPRPLYRKL